MQTHPYLEVPLSDIVQASDPARLLATRGYVVDLQRESRPTPESGGLWLWMITVTPSDGGEPYRNRMDFDSLTGGDSFYWINNPLQSMFDAYCTALLQHLGA